VNDECEGHERVSKDHACVISDYGFAAMLREEETETSSSGILGTPRVTPTRRGLQIEDFDDAAIDSILLAILEGGSTRDLIVAQAPPSAPVREGLERIKRGVSGGAARMRTTGTRAGGRLAGVA
jgi:hypothetical protein